MIQAKLDYQPAETEVIAFQNDLFRSNLGQHSYVKGRFTATSGVVSRGGDFLGRAIVAVCNFTAFTAEDDPHGEHNFGVVYVAGVKLYFRIDLYDADYKYGSDAPFDLAVTRRVLTIMLPQEY